MKSLVLCHGMPWVAAQPLGTALLRSDGPGTAEILAFLGREWPMHRHHHRPPPLWVSRDPAHLQEVLLTLPLFDPLHNDSLYDLRHDQRRRVLCPQRGVLVVALADALWAARQQRSVQTRKATVLRRQLTRLIKVFAALQETGDTSARPIRQPHVRLLQRAHAALTALLRTDLHTLVHPGPPTPDISLLLALYRAFVHYGPPLQAYPRDAIYMALALLWQAFTPGHPASQLPPLSTLAARLGRRMRRHAGPASSSPTW